MCFFDTWDFNFESPKAGGDLMAGSLNHQQAHLLTCLVANVSSQQAYWPEAPTQVPFMWLLVGLSHSIVVVFQEQVPKKIQAEPVSLLMN